jgi:hypothetical protein
MLRFLCSEGGSGITSARTVAAKGSIGVERARPVTETQPALGTGPRWCAAATAYPSGMRAAETENLVLEICTALPEVTEGLKSWRAWVFCR